MVVKFKKMSVTHKLDRKTDRIIEIAQNPVQIENVSIKLVGVEKITEKLIE